MLELRRPVEQIQSNPERKSSQLASTSPEPTAVNVIRSEESGFVAFLKSMIAVGGEFSTMTSVLEVFQIPRCSGRSSDTRRVI